MTVLGTDISFWDDDPTTFAPVNFVRMREAGARFCFIRVGQGNFIDPTFHANWENAKSFRFPRGSFWYYDNEVNPITQANKCAYEFNGDFGELFLFADFEDTTEGAYKGWRNYKTFLEQLKASTGGRVRIGIYTAFYFWRDKVAVPLLEYEYFKQYPLWVANYGVSVPAVPQPWTGWKFWQFTELGSGSLYGTESRTVDLNYYNGTEEQFSVEFGVDAIPGGEEIVVDGPIEYRKFHFKNSWVYAAIVTPGPSVRFEITRPANKVCSLVAMETGAKLVTNGGHYIGSVPDGLHVVRGRFYHGQNEYEPFVNFDENEKPSIRQYLDASTAFSAVSAKRNIVVGGHRSATFSPAWYERHPRTLAGVSTDGKYITAVVDGRQEYSESITLFDAAEIMILLGADRAIDLDGGGSSTFVLDGLVKNVPIDMGIPGKERAVLNHVVIYTEPEGEPQVYRYSASSNMNRSLRTGHSVFQSTIENIPAGAIVSGDELWTAPADGNYVRSGDQWLHVLSINGRAVDGWTSIVHLSLEQMVLVDNQTPPPPSEEVVTVDIFVYRNGVLTNKIIGQVVPKV